MSRTIHRYATPLIERMEFRLPRGAEILEIAAARSGVSGVELWALIDPDQPPEPRMLIAVGTGHPVPDDVGQHLATLAFQSGRLIFHVFEGPQS